MSNLPLPIQFLLKQLEKEENRERFNRRSYNPISPDITDSFDDLLFLSLIIDDYINFYELSELEKIGIVRTCLSRTKEGEAVIDVLKQLDSISLRQINSQPYQIGQYYVEAKTYIEAYNQLDELRKAYADPLDNGKSLDQAIDALDQKMLELVPEYKEFCKNNN